MAVGFADRLLDVAFKFAKIVSVFLAVVLILAFLVGLGWSIKQVVSGSGLNQPSFDTEMNESMQANTGKDQGGAMADSQVDASNKVRATYGNDMGNAMKKANCSAQFDSAMKQLAIIAADKDNAAFLDEVANGAVRWFEDAATYQKAVGNANPDWYCGEGYWQSAQTKLEEAQVMQAARKLEIMQGFGAALITLLAAFVLMVIPAIYRIEESVRNRAP